MLESPYSHKLVAFFDILGFRDLINQSRADPAIAKAALHALSLVADPLAPVEDRHPSFQRSTFSDCTCITRDDDQESRDRVVAGLATSSLAMLNLGFPLRGSVVTGPVFHMNGVLMGPALIEAYDLESRVANFPRIILGPHLNYTPSDEIKGYKLIEEDFDGHLFISFLSPSWAAQVCSVVGIGYDEARARVASSIAFLKERAAGRPDIMTKVGWLRSYARRMGYDVV